MISMNQYILSIDQGTTGTTVSLINERGEIEVSSDHDFPQIFPKPGWVEHDLNLIWKTVLDGITKVLQQSRVAGASIAAIGITNQRETVGVWENGSQRPLYHAIVWQCRRTTDFCERLRKKGVGPDVKRRTGLVLDPYFSASKLRWFLDHVPNLKQQVDSGNVRVGTIDSFLVDRLSGGASHATDVSNASRTQLFNIKSGEWDPVLLKLFRIPIKILPKVVSSSGVVAHTKGIPGLPDGIPISGIAGDQQAALFGQGCWEAGDAKCTFGTGSFLLLNTGSKIKTSRAGLLSTVAWQLKSGGPLTYALEGSVFVCGAAVQWLRDNLGFINTSKEIEALAASVPDTAGVEFVPALTGLGAPHWDPDARGLICGLTRGTSRGHLARATLESMALQNVDVFKAMEKDLGRKLKSIRVDGGATENQLLMQLQADFLGLPVDRPQQLESTTLGAAYLAGLGIGLWDWSTLKKLRTQGRVFKPKMSSRDRERRLVRWHEAVERAKS